MKKAIFAFLLLLSILLSTNAKAAVLEFISTSRGDVPVWVPDDYMPGEPLPLVMALHGRSGTSETIEAYFDLQHQVDQRRFIYVIPQGTTNIIGTFWNATDACCDLFGSNVDDSGYLRGVIELTQSTYSIDADRIHLVGYSNGGFMSHRMAIDHADLIASIVSVAGANFKDAQIFQPSEQVHTLEIHGTSDDVIFYNGGSILGVPYPGAVETQSHWAFYNQLDSEIEDVGTPFDLDLSVSGPEATIKVFDPDNEPGIRVELWTLTGSGHGPNFGDGPSNRFAQLALDWAFDHPKPQMDLVTPESAELVQGESVSGGVFELLNSDDQDWIVVRGVGDIEAQTIVDISATCPTAIPNSIRIRFEGSVFARPQLSQTIQLFDYDMQLWEAVDTRTASRFTDMVVEIRPTGDVTRFVDPITRQMEARIIHQAEPNRAQFSASLDQVAWIVFY